MKNAIKISILALTVSFAAAACHSNGSGNGQDSLNKDSVATTDTTAKADTSVKADSATMKADTAKAAGAAGMDTVKSTSKKTTVKTVTSKKQ